MNNDMFQKLLAGERNKLEYKLMRYYYDNDMNDNRKVTFMLAQYADTLKDIAHTATGYCRSDEEIQLTPDQIDNLTSTLGGLFFEYILKVQGKTINDALGRVFSDLIIDDCEEDN